MRAVVSGAAEESSIAPKASNSKEPYQDKIRNFICSFDFLVKRTSIVVDALPHIYMLKLNLEAVHREYLHLMAIKTDYINLIKHLRVREEVKVEKIEEGFHVRVKCEKAKDTLVSVLEVFEEMGLNVVQARVSCNNNFSMEAIAAVADHQNQEKLDVIVVTQTILRATKINKDGKETHE